MLSADFENIPFLRNAPKSVIKDVAEHATWFSLPGGWPLYLENEPSNMMWFVRTGSLSVYGKTPDGRTDLVGHIRAGEPVGEMSLIAGEPHSASVFASRDTELFGLDAKVFNRLVRRHQDLMLSLSRTILFRTRQKRRRNPSQPKIFSLLSASLSIEIMTRADIIADEIRKQGRTCIVVGEEGADAGAGFFDEIESKYDIIILASQLGEGLWPQICLRQADRIMVFGRTDARPSTPLLPDDPSPARDFKLIDMVLVSAVGKAPISKAIAWLEAAGASRVLNWREGNQSDISFLARTITGNSVGLVLSGGGARAMAHIGVVRALREAGIRFDFIGGTSMGGVVGACVGIGWNDDKIEKVIYDSFVASNPLNDYVLPVISLVSGKKVDERLKGHFGEINIEEMERPFFCVSSNLQTVSTKIHRTGNLANALRASIALPGILPPVVMGNDVLVDGAVLNNFPINIMSQNHKGKNYGSDVSQERNIDASEFVNPPNFFSWVVKNGFHAPPPIAELLMRSATMTINPNKGRAGFDIVVNPEVEDIKLRDWKAFDKAIEKGYNAAVKKLREDDEIAFIS